MIGAAVDVPQGVSLRGAGKWETTFKQSASRARLRCNEYDSGAANGNRRGGSCSAFEIDGDETATLCMDV